MDDINRYYEAAYALAEQDGIEGYILKHVGTFRGSPVFTCDPPGEEVVYTGFPLYILIEGNQARFADHKETMELMDKY